MEEQIFEILKSNTKLLTYASREEYEVKSAKEITDHIFEFIKWKDESIRTYHHAVGIIDTAENLYSLVSEDKITHVTIENLYIYWFNTIYNKGIEMIPVTSSQIKSVGYKDNTLYIEFLKGTVYTYNNVPKSVVEDFLKFNSKGKFFTMAIKGKYEYSKIDKLVTNGQLV